MRRAQQVVDVGERGLAERAQCLALDHQHILPHHFLDLGAADLELAIRGLVRAKRKQRRMVIGWRGGGRNGGVHRHSDEVVFWQL